MDNADFRPVTVYIHEQTDSTHLSRDYLAFIVGIVDENTVDVVIFPPGGPLRWERVSRFDPDDRRWDEQRPRPVGMTYWREQGEDLPDLESAYADRPVPIGMEMEPDEPKGETRRDA